MDSQDYTNPSTLPDRCGKCGAPVDSRGYHIQLEDTNTVVINRAARQAAQGPVEPLRKRFQADPEMQARSEKRKERGKRCRHCRRPMTQCNCPGWR